METTFARLVEHLAPRWLARLGRGLLGGCLGLGLAMGAGSVGAGVEMSGLGPLVLPELVGLSLPVKPNGAEATKAPLNPVAPTPDPAIRAKVQSNLGRQPLYFEPNLGQFDPEVKFLARGRGYNLFLTESEAVWVWRGERPIAAIEASNQPPLRGRHLPGLPKPALSLSESPPAVLRMQFASFPLPTPALVGSEPRQGVSHYYQGRDPAGWHTDVPRYGRVSYPEIYPGVELAFYEGAQGLEYDFRLAPGVDANVIRLSFEGADEVRTDEAGNLVLRVAGRELVHMAPTVYQEIDGERRAVAARYRTLGLSDGEAAQIAFAVAEHNLDVPLVIDPVVGTYFSQGGSAGYYDIEEGYGIAVDNDGNIYVTGFTDSADFPTLNAFDAIYGGGGDVFVTKFSPEGQILWSTYLGGSNSELGFAIAIDSAGNVYTGGPTDSPDFPLLNAWDSTLDVACGVSGTGGECFLTSDAFVAKFSKDGELLWSTYLGGGYQPQVWEINNIIHQGWAHFLSSVGGDSVSGIAVDNSGNVYVAGGTGSTDFPLLNAQDASYGRFCYLLSPDFGYCNILVSDAFVAKFNTHGQLLWSTYLGGSGDDSATDIAIDGDGNVYVAGYTSDLCPDPRVYYCFPNDDITYSENFPTLNAWDSSIDSFDAFVTKFSPDGQLLWSTYLGGSSVDVAESIAVESNGNVYVSGRTSSTDFPRLNAADVMVGGGPSENDSAAFITKFNPDGQVLWSLRLGGSSWDDAAGIAVDNVGAVYVTGPTASVDFPMLDAWVATFPENILHSQVVYVSKFNQDGQMLWSTYASLMFRLSSFDLNYWGVWPSLGHNIAVNSQGAVYVTAAGDNGEGPAALVLKLSYPPDKSLELLDLACNNSEGPCSGDYLTTNQNGTLVPVSSPERLRELQVQRDGVVADGVTKLLLRLKTDSDRPVTFQILPPDGVPAAEASPCRWGTLRDRQWTQSSCQAITLAPDQLSSGDYYAFAVYEAPLDNPTDTKSQIRLQAVVDGGDPIIRSLGIEPPPVMLVHGVWSSPRAWWVVAQFLRDHYGFNQGLGKDLELVDHSDIDQSAGSFDPHWRSFVIGKLIGAIRQVQDNVRSRGIAITQVDVVAHSMGGLITRALEKYSWSGSRYRYKRRANYMAGDVHKLIAVGTPHQGTRIADTLIENKCNQLLGLGMTLEEVLQRAGQPLGQAVYGFQTGSLPIRHIGNSTIPSHAIVGLAPTTSDTEENLNQLMWRFDVLATVDNLLGGDKEHDTIVPRISQRGGMDEHRRTEVSGVVHADVEIFDVLTSPDDVNETLSRDILEQMVGLLREPVQDGKFGGFAALPAGGVYREPYTCPASLSQSTAASTQADVAFTPAPGTTVTPGQVVSISLSVTGGNATDAAMFIVDGRWRFLQGPGPYAMDYLVPGEKAGRIPIMGLTFGPGPDNYMMETHILVQPGEPLTSLDASPAHLALDAGSTYSIRVSGRFANGARIDLTSGSAGTTYATLSGTTDILSVSPDGIVEARVAGKESILISYANLSTSVLVTVEEPLLVPGPAMPVITSGPSGTTNVSSASFTFSGEVGVGFECALDDGSYEACASPFQVQAPSGTHIFSVRAINAEGLVSDPAVRQWNSVTTTFSGGEGDGSAEIDTSNGTGCGFDPTQTGFVAATNPPANLSFPHGLFHFRLVGCDPGSTVTLKVRWTGQAGGQYWKFNPRTSQWYPYPGASFNPLNSTWTFQIKDNGPHDADPTPGSILDPAGPARISVPGGGSGQSANPIPTLSSWMLLALVGLLGVLVFGVHRARRGTMGS